MSKIGAYYFFFFSIAGGVERLRIEFPKLLFSPIYYFFFTLYLVSIEEVPRLSDFLLSPRDYDDIVLERILSYFLCAHRFYSN